MTLDILNITTPYKATKFIHLLDSEYSFWRNYQVTSTFIIIIIIVVASKMLLRSLYETKMLFTCIKYLPYAQNELFLFTWRVKYMNFMHLTGTGISHFFPILATSHFVFSKIGHIPIPRRGPINLYRCSDGDFGALTLCQTVFRPVGVLWH